MKVLICDAEAVLLSAIEFRLRKYGLELLHVPLKEASQILSQQKTQLVIIDTENDPAGSLQLLRQVKESSTPMPVVVISSVEDEEELWAALQAGADDFVTKPFKLIELVIRVRRLLNNIGK